MTEKLRKKCPDCNEEFSAYFQESLDTLVAIHRVGIHGKLSVAQPVKLTSNLFEDNLNAYDRALLSGMKISLV